MYALSLPFNMNFSILVLHWYFMLIVQGNSLQDKKKVEIDIFMSEMCTK